MLGGYVASAAKGAHVSTVILLPDAVVMLVAGLTASLLLENFVEPKVMGRTLATHPLIALVTTLGGLIGGMLGLMLAVAPFVMPVTPSPAFIGRLLRTGGRPCQNDRAALARLTSIAR